MDPMTKEQEEMNQVSDKLMGAACHEEQFRQMQAMAYRSGRYAVLSEMISRLMSMQAATVKTPYDQP
jgi:hypothetical protein